MLRAVTKKRLIRLESLDSLRSSVAVSPARPSANLNKYLGDRIGGIGAPSLIRTRNKTAMAGAASAAVSPAEIEALRKQVEDLKVRIVFHLWFPCRA